VRPAATEPPDDEQRAVDRQPACTRDRLALVAGEDDRGATELLQLRRRILGLAVDVPPRTEPAGVRLLVLAGAHADRVEAILAAYCTPRWPSPPRPSTATTSPGRAPLWRSALKVVRPAHIRGAASTGQDPPASAPRR